MLLKSIQIVVAVPKNGLTKMSVFSGEQACTVKMRWWGGRPVPGENLQRPYRNEAERELFGCSVPFPQGIAPRARRCDGTRRCL